MKATTIVKHFLDYHSINSKKNTIRNQAFCLTRFDVQFGNREIDSISIEEIMSFLTGLTKDTKQTTKRGRYTCLKTLFNFAISTFDLEFKNPCDATILKKIFREAKPKLWPILNKDIIDEIIFRTMNTRNRIMLELMARGGMRIGEVLNLRPRNIEDRKIIIEEPKSGKEAEVVFIPQKVADRLMEYTRLKEIKTDQYIFPITYSAARRMVNRSGKMVDIHLRPHDLRRHAATFASRSGTPIEIVSKIILRHANLSTTQRYLGQVSDHEAMRWIENLYG
jgi:integrase/recombinase XerD